MRLWINRTKLVQMGNPAQNDNDIIAVHITVSVCVCAFLAGFRNHSLRILCYKSRKQNSIRHINYIVAVHIERIAVRCNSRNCADNICHLSDRSAQRDLRRICLISADIEVIF